MRGRPTLPLPTPALPASARPTFAGPTLAGPTLAQPKLALAALLLASAPPAHAGAWLQPEGRALVITTMEASAATRLFDASGSLQDGPRFAKYEVRQYGELGLSRRITLLGQTSVQRIDLRNPSWSAVYTGLSEAQIGARVPVLSRGRHRLSAEARAGYHFGGEFIAGGDLLYGGPVLEARALYGYGWNRAYVDLQGGYRSRAGQGPGTWLADAGAGVNLGPLSVSAGASLRETGEGELADRAFVRGTESLKLRLGASLRVRRNTRIELTRHTTVSGRRHVAESGYGLAVWTDF